LQDEKDSPSISEDQLAQTLTQSKHHKQALKEGIEQFNWNAKKVYFLSFFLSFFFFEIQGQKKFDLN